MEKGRGVAEQARTRRSVHSSGRSLLSGMPRTSSLLHGMPRRVYSSCILLYSSGQKSLLNPFSSPLVLQSPRLQAKAHEASRPLEAISCTHITSDKQATRKHQPDFPARREPRPPCSLRSSLTLCAQPRAPSNRESRQIPTVLWLACCVSSCARP